MIADSAVANGKFLILHNAPQRHFSARQYDRHMLLELLTVPQ